MPSIQQLNNTVINWLLQSSPHTKWIELKIKELQQLKPGWDFGEGESITDDVAAMSLKIAEQGLLLGLNANVSPSVDGSIIVSLFHNDRFLFISVRSDKLFDVVYEKGIGVEYETLYSKEDLNFKSVKEYIEQWVLSEHYTSSNITRMQNVLGAMPLRNTGMEESPYLTMNVQGRQAETLYVSTLKNFTTPQLETQFAFAE